MYIHMRMYVHMYCAHSVCILHCTGLQGKCGAYVQMYVL